jgi:hypothetical protein
LAAQLKDLEIKQNEIKIEQDEKKRADLIAEYKEME